MLCGNCRLAIQVPFTATDDTVVCCPKCGAADTLANVKTEVDAFVAEMVALSVEGQKAPPARPFRFVIDFGS